MIQRAASGRGFGLGQPYIATTDQVSPMPAIWPKEVVDRCTTRLPSDATTASFVRCSNSEELASALDVNLELKATFSFGQVRGMGAMTQQRNKSSRRCQAAIKYEAKTATVKFDGTIFDYDKKLVRAAAKVGATHIIMSLACGARALLVFELEASSVDEASTLQGELDVVVELLAQGTGKVKFTESQKRVFERCSTRFETEGIIREAIPQDTKGRMAFFSNLNNKISQGGLGVPLSASMTPIDEVLGMAMPLYWRVSDANLRLATQMYDGYQKVKNDIDDLLHPSHGHRALKTFPRFGTTVGVVLKKVATSMRARLADGLRVILPALRSTRAGHGAEGDLLALLQEMDASAASVTALTAAYENLRSVLCALERDPKFHRGEEPMLDMCPDAGSIRRIASDAAFAGHATSIPKTLVYFHVDAPQAAPTGDGPATVSLASLAATAQAMDVCQDNFQAEMNQLQQHLGRGDTGTPPSSKVEEGEEDVEGGHKAAARVMLVGMTGAGKSTLSQWLTGRSGYHVGHERASQTHDPAILPSTFFGLQHAGAEILRVMDTPGADDTQGRDSELLRKTADMMASEGGFDVLVFVLSGTQRRLLSPLRRLIKLFRGTLGKRMWSHVVIVLTKFEWRADPTSTSKYETGHNEASLIEMTQHWRGCLQEVERLVSGGHDCEAINEVPVVGVNLPAKFTAQSLAEDGIRILQVMGGTDDDRTAAASMVRGALGHTVDQLLTLQGLVTSLRLRNGNLPMPLPQGDGPLADRMAWEPPTITAYTHALQTLQVGCVMRCMVPRVTGMAEDGMWRVTSGELPPGVELTPTGWVRGTPTEATPDGGVAVQIVAANSAGSSKPHTLRLVVKTAPTVPPARARTYLQRVAAIKSAVKAFHAHNTDMKLVVVDHASFPSCARQLGVDIRKPSLVWVHAGRCMNPPADIIHLPTQKVAPQAKALQSNGCVQVRYAWSCSPHLAITACTATGLTGGAAVAEADATTCTVKGIKNGQRHEMRVVATAGGVWQGPPSSPVAFSVSLAPPTALSAKWQGAALRAETKVSRVTCVPASMTAPATVPTTFTWRSHSQTASSKPVAHATFTGANVHKPQVVAAHGAIGTVVSAKVTATCAAVPKPPPSEKVEEKPVPSLGDATHFETTASDWGNESLIYLDRQPVRAPEGSVLTGFKLFRPSLETLAYKGTSRAPLRCKLGPRHSGRSNSSRDHKYTGPLSHLRVCAPSGFALEYFRLVRPTKSSVAYEFSCRQVLTLGGAPARVGPPVEHLGPWQTNHGGTIWLDRIGVPDCGSNNILVGFQRQSKGSQHRYLWITQALLK